MILFTLLFGKLLGIVSSIGLGPLTLYNSMNGMEFNITGQYLGDLPTTFEIKPYVGIKQNEYFYSPLYHDYGVFKEYVSENGSYIYHQYVNGSTEDGCSSTPREMRLEFICDSGTALDNLTDYGPCTYYGKLKTPYACGFSYLVGEELPTPSVTPSVSVSASESASVTNTPSETPSMSITISNTATNTETRTASATNTGTRTASASPIILRSNFLNYGSPGGCPSSTSNVLNIVVSINAPAGSSGIQIKQVSYSIRSGSFTQPSTMMISGNGRSGSVNPASSAQMCCSGTSCDMANYFGGSWYSTGCGSQTSCSPFVQWYKLDFSNTPIGTCNGCGITGSSVGLNIDFGGAALPISDYGAGTTFYISYYGMVPATPTATMTATASQSMISQSVTPSETASLSQSPSVTPTELSPSISTSISPSESISSSESASVTPSMSVSSSVSNSPSGMCYVVNNLLYGKVYTDGYYKVVHGINASHAYNPAPIMLGVNPTCTETPGICTCAYTGGSTFSCPYTRSATLRYQYGPSTTMTFVSESPVCRYTFNMFINFNSQSSTPSPSSSQSNSQSVSNSMSSSVTQTPSSSQSNSQSVSVSTSVSPSKSISITPTPPFFISRWPSLSASSTITSSKSPSYFITAYPSRKYNSSTSTSTPKLYKVYYPSPTSSPKIIIKEDESGSNLGIILGSIAVGLVGIGTTAVIIQNKKKNNSDNQDKNQDKNNTNDSDNINDSDNSKHIENINNQDNNYIEETEENENKTINETSKNNRKLDNISEISAFYNKYMNEEDEEDEESSIIQVNNEDLLEIKRILRENGKDFRIITSQIRRSLNNA